MLQGSAGGSATSSDQWGESIFRVQLKVKLEKEKSIVGVFESGAVAQRRFLPSKTVCNVTCDVCWDICIMPCVAITTPILNVHYTHFTSPAVK